MTAGVNTCMTARANYKLFADAPTNVRSDQRLVGHLQMLAGHSTIDPCMLRFLTAVY